MIESGHTIITVSLQNLTEPMMGIPGSVTGSIRWFSLCDGAQPDPKERRAMPHEELRDHPDVAGVLYMT